MADERSIIRRVRKELGDLANPFRENYRGTGVQDEFDLPVIRVNRETLRVFTVSGSTLTDLVLDADFTLDPETGVLRLSAGPLPLDVLLVVEGSAYGLFSDEELAEYVEDAVLQHTYGMTDSVRYRSADGFIRYEKYQRDLEALPEVEELPVALLATIEVLWALSTDAATDINVTTSDGTFVDRGQRYQQLVAQITLLTDRYQALASALNVGLWRVETFDLRRISRTNNRLVPLYVAREYDDHSSPTRIVRRIDDRDADYDGPPSAANQGLY